MAKLHLDDISDKDILEYLQKNSDFSFEVKVLRELHKIGLKCQHSGTYTDPITRKTREFDIRSTYFKALNPTSIFQAHLAIECKNLGKHFPLVIHCMPRQKHEAYINVMMTYFNKISNGARAKVIKRSRFFDPYHAGDAVGKSSDQVGRSASAKELYSSDSDVFEKISQAINSCKDLVDTTSQSGSGTYLTLTAICPILVVPDGTLWQILYDGNGDVIAQPTQVDNISYYFGKEWSFVPGEHGKDVFSISHLNIATFSGMTKAINDIILLEDDELKDLFIEARSGGNLPQYLQ